jgi:hypothetical protein
VVERCAYALRARSREGLEVEDVGKGKFGLYRRVELWCEVWTKDEKQGY